MITLKDWISQLTLSARTIIINGVDVVDFHMWDSVKLKWGSRESVLTMEEMNDYWTSYRYTHNENWKRVVKALTVDYSPIENTDRYEDITDTTTHTGTDNTTNSNTLTKTGTDTLARTGTDTLARTGTDTLATTLNTTVKTDTDNKHKKNAYDGDNTVLDFNDDNTETQKTSGGDTNTTTYATTDTTTYGASDTTTHNTTDSESGNNNRTVNLTDTLHHINHTHGNIGVTRNDELINYELALRLKHTIFSEIVENFLLETFY